MNVVELRLFGDVRAVFGGTVLRRLPSMPCRRLLAYLAIHGDRPVKKRDIEEAVWPGEKPPPNRLSVTLYQLRRALQALDTSAGFIVEATRTHFRLDPTLVRVDAEDFARLYAIALSSASLEEGLAALSLYEQPLLDGWDEPWAEEAREEHRRMALRLCSSLVKKARSREDVAQVTRALAKVIEADRTLAAGIIESIRSLNGVGGSLVASVLAEQLVINANPKTEASLRSLKEEWGSLPARVGPRPGFWCLAILDHIPGPDIQGSLLLGGGRMGRTSDYWLSPSPEGALEVGQRILFVRPSSRVLLTLCYMDLDAPLPVGLRALKQSIPDAGIWIDSKAWRAYEGAALAVGSEDGPLIAVQDWGLGDFRGSGP